MDAPGEHLPETGLPRPAQALLGAVVAISSNLDMRQVLDRIVRSACELTGARYGALGVLASGGGLSDFITHGVTDEQRAEIGHPPRGHGILGLLIERPEPIRLARLQDHPASYGIPPHHPPMSTFLGVPVRVRGTVFGNLYLTEKAGGGPFTDEDETLVGALAVAAGFVIENARAYGRSERQRQWLEASARLNEALQPPIPLADAFQRIAVGTLSVAAARAVGVLRREPSGVRRLVAADGRDAPLLPGVLEELADSLGVAERTGEAAYRPLADGRTALILPLDTHLPGSVLLLVLSEGPGDDDLVGSFADQAALALDRVQALTDRAELALVSDRERIARDLHDVVIQRLFATGLLLRGVGTRLDAPELRERLERAVTELDTTISDIRSTIFQLRRHDDGTRVQVHALVQEYAPVLGFTPSVRTRGPVDTSVPAPVAAHLLAVLREALSNVARHAGATSAAVELEADATRLVLRVTDDGVGVPPRRRDSGLANVRRRAAELGGELGLARSTPTGTVLSWTVPLPR